MIDPKLVILPGDYVTISHSNNFYKVEAVIRDGEVAKDECVRSWKDDYPYNKPQPIQKRKKK